MTAKTGTESSVMPTTHTWPIRLVSTSSSSSMRPWSGFAVIFQTLPVEQEPLARTSPPPPCADAAPALPTAITGATAEAATTVAMRDLFMTSSESRCLPW